MTRRASMQSTFTKGEQDPDLSERGDLEAYYDSLASAPNSIFHPQGGFSDRGGFQLCSDAAVLASGAERRLRNRIVPLDVTADNLSAPNGGTASRLVDQDASTTLVTNAVTATPFVVFEVDLGQARRVDFVDLEGFRSELAGADECLAVEYYDGTWVTFADAVGVPAAKQIRTAVRTRRFGVTPGGPGGVPVVARQWRIVARSGANAIGQITVAGFRMWAETGVPCPTHCREVARDTATTYQVVIGERNVDIFAGQRYVASVPLPAAAQQVDNLWFTGGFDTMFVFHEMMVSQRIVRQGSAGEWNIDAIPFTNVPTLAEQVVFSGSQDEIQVISLSGLVAGTTFALFLGDQVTRPITVGDAADLPALVKAALQALPGVATAAADITAELADAATLSVQVRFAGANGNRAWPLLAPVASSGVSLPATTIEQAGLDASSTYMNARTGWPRCGIITDQRLLVAGFRAAPTSYRFSTNPNYYNFNSTGSPLTADLGFGGALDVKGVETIVGVFAGTHLTIFTHVREYFTLGTELDATAPVGFKSSTANGIARGVPLVTVDGATLFVQEGGNTLREFRYADSEQGYAAEPLTVLAPQVLKGVVDVAVRQARRVSDGNQLFLVNSDGTAGVITLLRSQKVVAGSPWRTWGQGFRSIMTSITHDVYAVIERNGQHWLERWMPGVPLDWATHSVGSLRTVITGADHLEGRTDVWAIADDELIGPLTVAGGQFTLDTPAADVRFGLLPEWETRGQVLREKLANSQPFRGPARIYEMELAVKATGQLQLSTNGGQWLDVPLVRTETRFRDGGPLQSGGDPTEPVYRRLYTGNVLLTGLLGVAEYPYWSLRRTVPAPVHIKSIRQEVAHRGDQFAGGS
jgi:hypothetical protein